MVVCNLVNLVLLTVGAFGAITPNLSESEPAAFRAGDVVTKKNVLIGYKETDIECLQEVQKTINKRQLIENSVRQGSVNADKQRCDIDAKSEAYGTCRDTGEAEGIGQQQHHSNYTFSVSPLDIRDHSRVQIFESLGYLVEEVKLAESADAGHSPAKGYEAGAIERSYFTIQVDPTDGEVHPSDLPTEPVSASWLKLVGVDNVSVPKCISGEDFLRAARSHACVEFAEFPAAVVLSGSDDFLPKRGSDFDLALPAQTDPLSSMNISIDVEVKVSHVGKDPRLPNDPLFSLQYYLDRIDAQSSWTLPRGKSMENITVAVIDTGCETTHRDLKRKLWVNENEICDNGIDDDQNGYIDDCNGFNFYGNDANLTEQTIHGTPISGAIGAEANNCYGIAGICWGCRLMCLRIGTTFFSTGAFAEAVNYAMSFGVKVINYSGDGPGAAAQLKAIEAAEKADILIVTSAGNWGCDVDAVSDCGENAYPGYYPNANIVNVGSTDAESNMSGFSNWGNKSVDIFAPGSDVLLPYKGDFKNHGGTSYAAPMVAGALGILRGRYPQFSAADAKRILLESCTVLPALKGKVRCSGLLNIRAAVQLADEEAGK